MSGPISLIFPVEYRQSNICCGFYSALSFMGILLASSFNNLLNNYLLRIILGVEGISKEIKIQIFP